MKITKRTLKEIRAEEKKLDDMVWYERKLVMFHNILENNEQMPDTETYDKIIENMKRITKELGYSGVKDDFEWGMINGKLSALRWVLGDEWDDLDT
jgi:hypothetical protein